MTPGLLLAGAIFGFAIALVTAFNAPRVWLAATVLGTSVTFSAAMMVLMTSGAAWEWQPGVRIGGEQIHLRMDPVSALFLALLGIIGGVGAVYGQGYWSERAHPRSARTSRVWWSVLVLCLGLVLLSANGLHFLMGWELFTIAAYYLVTLNRRSKEVRDSGWLYLGASHLAALFLFAFFAGLAAQTGGWELGPMRDRAELAPLFWLALVGFGLKAGLFPLHIWLPSAHANAPSHVSAMLSGMTLKIGIYGLVRFSGWLPVPDAAGWVVAALGIISAVLGVAFALGQHDLKRLLAYHSVENIGIILTGLGFAMVAVSQGHAPWGQLALAGGLLHVWNHGLFKALLFFCAGSVLHATGTREMSRLGGLWRAMPWTASFFALGAAAISGLPPLNGFVSEWLVYLGLFDAALAHGPAAWAAFPAVILLGVTGALALACFVKVCGVVFLGAARTDAAAHAHESGPAMRGGMLVLASGCVAVGLGPLLIWPAVARAVEAWQPAWPATTAPAPLAALNLVHLVLAALALIASFWLWRKVRGGAFRRAATWDCGYAAPTARMQYTAGSFAGIITEWFAWILRPQRHADPLEGDFPDRAEFAQHTPETVLEFVVEPAGGLVMRLSRAARRFQHGRVQAYLLYTVAGAAALALIVWLDGK